LGRKGSAASSQLPSAAAIVDHILSEVPIEQVFGCPIFAVNLFLKSETIVIK
jgi:hypothetical protein